MKKKYLVFLLLVVFIFAGFSCKWNQPKEADDSSPIDDFQSAIESGQKMKCTYKTDAQGGEMESTSYVQGDKYRSEYEFDGSTNVSVFDGSVIFTWNDETKQGTKMDIACMEGLSDDDEAEDFDEADYDDAQSTQELLDTGVDVKCSKVSSIDFTVPTDVQFVDQCEQLKESMKALEGLQDSLPDIEGFDFDY